MRKGLVCVALLFWASAVTGLGQPSKQGKAETLARWHFVGTRELSNAKDLDALREILALKESQALRDVAIEGFAAQMAARFNKSGNTNANAQLAALMKPLLPYVIENESEFELVSRGAQDTDWFLALNLPEERKAQWSKNLSDLASAAQMRITK